MTLVGEGLHFVAANVCAWGSGVAFGFLLNRRVTFRISGAAGFGGQLRRFLAGSLAQLVFSTLCLALLMDGAGLPAATAWLVTLVAATTAMFIYLNLFAFARGAQKAG
jgi:putative flippase GtrA